MSARKPHRRRVSASREAPLPALEVGPGPLQRSVGGRVGAQLHQLGEEVGGAQVQLHLEVPEGAGETPGRAALVEVAHHRHLVIEADRLAKNLVLPPAAAGEQLAAQLPDALHARVGVAVEAAQVVADGSAAAQQALLQRRAGVHLGAAVVERVGRVPAGEVEVGAHALRGGLGVKGDERVLGRDAQLLAERERRLRLGHGLLAADGVQPALGAGLDAHEDADQPQLLQPGEDAPLGVPGAALEHQPHVAHAGALQAAGQRLHPGAVVGVGGHQEVVIVEDELPHPALVVEGGHLLGHLLGGALAEAPAGSQAVQRGDAAVVAGVDAAAAAHQVGGGDAGHQPGRAGAIGPGQRIERIENGPGLGQPRQALAATHRHSAQRARAGQQAGAQIGQLHHRPFAFVDDDEVQLGVVLQQRLGGARRVVAPGDDRPRGRVGLEGAGQVEELRRAHLKAHRQTHQLGIRGGAQHGGRVGGSVKGGDGGRVPCGLQRGGEVAQREIRFQVWSDQQHSHRAAPWGRQTRHATGSVPLSRPEDVGDAS